MPRKSTKKVKNDNLISRPPVVVVMGHIDHGKTSLLMAVKDFGTLARESGGITQHVGAYQITVPSASKKKTEENRKITFIDTPGHESFSAIRSRGAKAADFAILVIDSAEGIKPQTKEAIKHAKEAGLPIIVALNKIDKPDANPDKVKSQLAKEDVLTESMGGDVPAVEMSAKTGKGVADLLELILLMAEMAEMKADITKPAKAVVIESYQDSKRGPTATLLIQEGKFAPGLFIGADSAAGRIKILENFLGENVKEALPGDPVVVIGFEQVPWVGEEVKIYKDLDEAQANVKKAERGVDIKTEVTGLGKTILNVILKVDFLGSLEAIKEILKTLPQDKVALRLVKAEVGDINESDIRLAKNLSAVIIAFRVKTNKIAQFLAEKEKIRIHEFQIIYELSQRIRELMEKSLAPEMVRTDVGKMKVLVIFLTEKNRQIIGGKIIEGEFKKGFRLEIWRGEPKEEQKIGHGRMLSLQANKKTVEIAKKGTECAIQCESETRAQEGDLLVLYKEEMHRGL
ncbi:MAG: translation initiation factor IF-2 [Candidatus Paceibacterota bacterium]|jgi:translation initiation factor IF-2